MRASFRTTFSLCLLIFFSPLVALSDQASGYAPVSVEMPLIRVSDAVYYVQGLAGSATEFEGFISNAAFVVTSEGVIVFDALGSPSLAQKLRQRIREVTDQPVVKVIVSHYHADHIYGLQVFKSEGAEIIAPLESIDYLESDAARERLDERRFSLDPWVNEQTHLVRPDVLIDKDMAFTLGGIQFQINHLGSAHSEGDLSLYIASDRVLLSGDIIFEGRVPFVGDADSKGWMSTLERMQTQQLAALVPGHGPVADKPNQAIALTYDYLGYLRQVMGEAVEELQEFDEVYAETDWSRFSHLPAFEEANRRNAYQVYLSMERELLDLQ